MVDWMKGFKLLFVISLVGFMFFLPVSVVVSVDFGLVLLTLQRFFASVFSLHFFAGVSLVLLSISVVVLKCAYDFGRGCPHYNNPNLRCCPLVPGGNFYECYKNCDKRPKFWRF